LKNAGGGTGVLIQVGKLRCSARIYCGRYCEIPQYKKEGPVLLPPSPNEYRTRHASAGEMEAPQIPHTYNRKTAGAHDTSVNTDHSVQTGFMIVWTSLYSHT
jgi:hypothetical protein